MIIDLVHFVAGFVALAESLNKLERCHPLRCGLGWRRGVTEWLKAVAWAFLAIGSAGALATPFLPMEKPALQDALVLLGFAVLIVRTRVKEG